MPLSSMVQGCIYSPFCKSALAISQCLEPLERSTSFYQGDLVETSFVRALLLCRMVGPSSPSQSVVL